jgi:hypothetical protein
MAKKRKQGGGSSKKNVKRGGRRHADGTEGKSKAACISAIATICAAMIAGTFALIPKLLQAPAPPLAEPITIDHPPWQDMEKPVVIWPKKAGSKYGFTQPPNIQIAGICSDRLQQDALCVQCDKSQVDKSSSLEEVEKQYIKILDKAGGKRLVAVFDSGSFISSSKSYAHTPHGCYTVLFKLVAQGHQGELCERFPFNYVYKENFKDLSKVLVTKDEFISIPEPNEGLEMCVIHGERRVSTNLTQKFDFKTDFCILGTFTVEFKDPHDPSSLDIAVCDAWGEKLSIVFADGLLNTFSIKAWGEHHGEGDVTFEGATIGVGRTIGDKRIANCFEIHVREQRGRTRCSLYLRHNSPILKGDIPIHSRLIDNLQFLTDFTHISLKLRKPGTVKLYDFEVAKLQ